MACDDEIVPLQERIETVGDDADLKEVYDTERHLLYVACTRARDHLLVTGVAPVSEFLDDFVKGDQFAGPLDEVDGVALTQHGPLSRPSRLGLIEAPSRPAR